MPFSFYINSLTGFALQLVPSALLLLVPFEKDSFRRGRRKSFFLITAEALALSFGFLIVAVRVEEIPEQANMINNFYMLLAILAVVLAAFYLIAEPAVRKFVVLFFVIIWSAVQYSLANILMDFLPVKAQDYTYDPLTVCSYLIVTALLLPLVCVFMSRTLKKYLNLIEPARLHPEFIFLIAVFALYMVLNAVYSAWWVQLRDTLDLGSQYYIPITLLLTALLVMTCFSTIRLAIIRDRNAALSLETALMKQSYVHLEENMQTQKRTLHDNRQLLRVLSGIAKDGTREELLTYIDKTLEQTKSTDTRFCVNSCINSVLQYYAGLCEAGEIVFHAQALCDVLPFEETDLAILLSNALENAVRSAMEYKEVNKAQEVRIRFVASVVKDQFVVQIDDPCLMVSFAPSKKTGWPFGQSEMLSASAFVSQYGGGYGLKRMEMIAEQYDGHVWFSFDDVKKTFTTRIMLSLNKENSNAHWNM